jgi:hypothetical protein
MEVAYPFFILLSRGRNRKATFGLRKGYAKLAKKISLKKEGKEAALRKDAIA